MGLLGDIVGGVSGLFGGDGSGVAERNYGELAKRYQNLNPTITAQQYGADAPTRGTQLDVLRNLSQVYGQGGLDAIGRSRIAGAETETNRNAQTLANSIQGRARAGGNTNSGVSLALEQGAGQDQAERTRQTGMDAAAEGENMRLGALSTAGGLATAAGGQQNAIDRYNAMARQTAAESTYNNQLSQLSGMGNAYGGQAGAAQQGYKNKVGAWGSLGSGIGEGAGGLSGYLSGPAAGGATGAWDPNNVPRLA